MNLLTPTGRRKSFLLLAVTLLVMASVNAQTTAFTYQGKLTDSGNLANGTYDLQFKLFDTVTVGTGTQQGSTVSVSNVTVTNGIFSVQLDFGACPTCFDGTARFLEIAVKATSGSNFTTLGPRQPVTSNPYAIRSLNSVAADGLSVACVSCVTSSQIQSLQGSQVSGTIPVASVPAGSASYIQNQNASPQQTSNFNISGNGTAGGTLSGNVINATTQYNLGGSPILISTGASLFAGIGAGAVNTGGGNSFFGFNAGNANTTAIRNSFFGALAGLSTTAGGSNSFFGIEAGKLNTSGAFNSFFGDGAGVSNTTANNNSFFGYNAGLLNTTEQDNTFLGYNAGSHNGMGDTNNFAINNTFVGSRAGQANTTGGNNSFVGSGAGMSNTDACCNAFFGYAAGQLNTTGVANAFFGFGAGFSNTTGTGNAFFGYTAGNSNTANNNAFFGSAAGSLNTTGINNAFFGSGAGQQNTTGEANAFFGFQAGRVNNAGGNAFFGFQAGQQNTMGDSNAFFGFQAGSFNTNGVNNAFFGFEAGLVNTTGFRNTIIGGQADFSGTNTTGNGNTLIGSASRVTANLSNATAIGAFASATQSNTLILGGITGVNSGTSVNVGIGVTAPTFKLHVIDPGNTGLRVETGTSGGTVASYGANGDFQVDAVNIAGGRLIVKQAGNVGIGTNAPNDKLEVNGIIRLATLGGAGSTQLCRNSSNQISTCSSSLRYKTNIAAYTSGLSLIKQLQPITFDWKADGMRDVGFGAEDVARVNPLFVTYNAKGEVEGVKYDRLSAVFVNAIKEQQEQLKERERYAARQQEEIGQVRQQLAAQQERATRQQTSILQQQAQLAAQQSEITAMRQLLCRHYPKAALCQAARQNKLQP